MDTHQLHLDVVADRTESMLLIPTILCGGSGSRLWPMSREALPKQFLPLLSEHSLLQETALRALGMAAGEVRVGAPLVVCNREHRFLVAAQLREISVVAPRIVLEPSGRNSAPAVAAAALLAAERDPNAILWIMPADAMIGDAAALRQAIALALPVARAGRIVTFGMQPSSPETGYGYIELGQPLAAWPGAFDVARFVEKPDAATAQVLASSGRHFWNSGMFVATAGVLLAEFETHAPDILAAVAQAIARGIEDADFFRLDEAAFAAAPAISLDYAIAERTTRAAVVPADFGWSDIGNWSTLWDAGVKDGRGNVALGDALLQDCAGTLVRSEGMLTAVVGMQDAVVVVTRDAVLVAHRDQAQQVKQVVERLRAAGRPEATVHARVRRPWGCYESLRQEGRYQVKRIMVEPGQKLSLQKHFHRAEHWIVVQGSALVTRDHERVLVGENESIYLPLGCVHRLENEGRIPLILIEVQVGSYLGEDDIVRLEDQYGR